MFVNTAEEKDEGYKLGVKNEYGSLGSDYYQTVFMHGDVHFGMLRLGGTGSASVRGRLVGPGKDLEQVRPHWQSQCHPARSVTSHS